MLAALHHHINMQPQTGCSVYCWESPACRAPFNPSRQQGGCCRYSTTAGATIAQRALKKAPVAPPGFNCEVKLVPVGITALLGDSPMRIRESLICYCGIIETVCAFKFVQCCWINKGLVLIYHLVHLKHTHISSFHQP